MERARQRRLKAAAGIDGTHQFQRHTVTRFSPEYRLYVDRSTRDEDMFTLELGQSSLRRASSRPIKNLLADEMYKEIGSTRRTSLTARLVGLEGLSSPAHLRQQERLSERCSCRQKNMSISIQTDRETYAGRCTRRSSREHHELHDVYNDFEQSDFVERRYSSRWSASSMLSKHEIALIEHKFKRSQGSIELDVNANRTRGSHVAVSKPPNSARYEGNSRAWKSEREISKRNVSCHVERKDGLLLEQSNYHRAHAPRRSSKIQLEEENEDVIVLLKPKRGYGRYSREMEETFVKPMTKEIRDRARETMRELRVETINSTCRGYAGDESSYDTRESDFDSETDMFKLSSRNSFRDGDNKWSRKSQSYGPGEWSRKEAKERLSERWKVTRKYQDLEIVGKSKTLGEMLAKPDKQTRPKRLNATRNDPLDISSRYGWKDEISKTLSRPKPFPSSIDNGSHKRGTHHETMAEKKNRVRFEPIRLCRVKIAKRSRSHKEVSLSQGSKSKGKKPIHREHIYSNEKSSSEANFEIEMEANVKDLSHQMFPMAAKDNTIGSPVSEVTTLQLVPKQPSSVVDDDKVDARDQTDPTLQESDKTSPEQGSSSLQYILAEADKSSESSKEADHTSPISVFEVPSTEDTSSCSDSFDRFNAELHELRMQLQLLKMESSSNAELSTLDPIEKKIAELYSILSEGNDISGVEAWEIAYALDVLIESGFQESDFDMLTAKWHSPDYPLDPQIFNDLEKHYIDENIELKFERKIIFDKINWAIVEIFQQDFDFFPWVMPKFLGLSREKGALDGLENLINRVFAGVEIAERVLDRETMWSDYKGVINEMGNEIEEMLIDGMISELIS